MDKNGFSMRQVMGGFGIRSMDENKGRKGRIVFHFTLLAIAFCISVLYHGMRPIMRLGGMVASGGPYAIAHPAPSWVWVIPLSIMFGMACVFINMFSHDPDGVNLMPLAWPGLFLSLGWNFLEFAFHPPGGGFAWGWLICGVVFAAMGGIPLLLVFKPVREKMRARSQSGAGMGPYIGQGLLAVAGVVLGIIFFRAVAG
jgi:hypothetical protein